LAHKKKGLAFPQVLVSSEVAGGGFEPPTDPRISEENSENRGQAAQIPAHLQTETAVTDHDLAVVVKAWPDLPAEVRKMIVGVITFTPKATH
jgi:hypothetical protein